MHRYFSILRRRRAISIGRQKTDDRVHAGNELQYGTVPTSGLQPRGRETDYLGASVEICINKLSDGP